MLSPQESRHLTDLNQFVKSRDIGTFSELLAAVEKLDGFEAGTLSAVKTRSWKAMSGFTHTGFNQIVRRLTESTIQASYDEGEVLEALMFACGVGWLAAIAICNLAENGNLANAILDKVKEVWPSEPDANV